MRRVLIRLYRVGLRQNIFNLRMNGLVVKASDFQHWISFLTRVRYPVVPTNSMYQVSGDFNCSDTLKAKYHHLRSDAEIAKL